MAGLRKELFMSVYTIDRENNITVFASLKEIKASGGETESFSNPEDLAALADQWPGARLVEIWSGLPGVEPVQRFTSRKVAVTRIWKAIQHRRGGLSAPDGVQQARRQPEEEPRRRPDSQQNSKTA
jgi:hypothetical protein